ncbi:YadA-like family protein, partial [Salmonella enterica]
AVNGSQLFATNENVSQNTADITTNTNSINQNTTDIATNTTNINNLSDSITTLTDDALLWDADSGTFSASRSGSASKITNLAAGTLAADSTDAVNGSQLYETNQKVDQNTSDIADINTTITNLSTDALSWNETTSSFSASHGSSTTNKITNVAAGELSEESTDAVNGSQLFETNEKVDQNTTDIAANTTNITQNSTAIENLNTSVSDINTSITGLTDNALLWDEDIGAFSANHGGSTSKITNVAAGALSEDSTDAVNGSQLYETNQKVDQNTSAIADINTSITNLGTDALSWDDEEGAFSASHGTSGTNKITNVAAGEIASDSTDAVNGSQLYETNMLISQYNESISQLAGDTSETYITENGTGVKYIRTNDNGLEGQDAYATGNGATAVGYDAVASGAGSLALGQNSSSSIEGSIALGSGSTSNRAITTGIRETSATSDGVVIGYNTTDRKLLGALSLGTDGESYRQITNVAAGVNNTDAVNVAQLKASEAGSVRYETNADGSVNYSVLNLGDGSGGTTRIGNVSAAVNDTDAVNYAQLKRSVEEANTYTDQKMGEMNSKIKGVENKMSGGIASAMAMAGLPQAYAPGANMTSIAGGTFNGESAVAIGVSMVSESGGWVYKLQGTSNSQGDYSAAIGAGFQW